MKWAVLVLAVSILYPASGSAAEIATIYGSPSQQLDFVREIVTERVDLIPSQIHESEISTRLYSILARRHVTSAAAIEVISEEGSIEGLYEDAIREAAARAPVVHTIVGGSDEFTNTACREMARFHNTVFVVPAGNSADQRELNQMPYCAAVNIVFYTSLNRARTDLADSASFGDLVRIAAPASDIPVTGTDGKAIRSNSSAYAGALVASNLAVFARDHAVSLRGGSLVEAFLNERTISLPSLQGKLRTNLALDDSGL